MNKVMNVGKGITIVATAAALIAGVTATVAHAAPRCICPMIYAPVQCDNGRTYSNQCFANCARATGCVPIGGPYPY
jgi:hypothetical protein